MQEFLLDDILFVIGAAIVLAFIGAAILKKAGIPQTLGFMLTGVLLGLVGILTDDLVHALSFMVSLALGLIGYNIGHELQSERLQGRIKRLLGIVIIEASAAFLLVTFLTYLLLQQLHIAILFGALASATAPAATADVVWECECEG
ncbi:MAG: cation:proton antiporter, partial [Candidatus Thorarchaeota archaeon]